MVRPPRFGPGAFQTGQIEEDLVAILQAQVEQARILNDLLTDVFIRGARATLPTVKTNITPDEILFLLMQGAFVGRIDPQPIQFDFFAPAGLTTEVSLPLKPGTITIFIGNTEFKSTIHQPGISFNIFLDGKILLTFDQSLYLDRTLQLSIVQYAKRIFPSVTHEIHVNNFSSLDTTISVQLFQISLEKSLHDEFVIPVIEKSSRELNLIEEVKR